MCCVLNHLTFFHKYLRVVGGGQVRGGHLGRVKLKHLTPVCLSIVDDAAAMPLALVSRQVRAVPCDEVANVTLERLLPSVTMHVLLQRLLRGGGVVTLLTFKGPFSCVPLQVRRETALGLR